MTITTNTHEPQPQIPETRRFAWPILVLVGVVFVLWPLSSGPMIWLALNGFLPEALEPVLTVIYQPWGWLSERVEPVDQFFQWYVGLWVPIPW